MVFSSQMEARRRDGHVRGVGYVDSEREGVILRHSMNAREKSSVK
jgi:hypothetical protein